MSTFVPGPLRRSIGPDAFVDLTGAEVLVEEIRSDGIVFDADLDEATVDAIRCRMTSTDDADQTARATLRADRDALPELDPLRRLYDYLLGDA